MGKKIEEENNPTKTHKNTKYNRLATTEEPDFSKKSQWASVNYHFISGCSHLHRPPPTWFL